MKPTTQNVQDFFPLEHQNIMEEKSNIGLQHSKQGIVGQKAGSVQTHSVSSTAKSYSVNGPNIRLHLHDVLSF